MSDIIEKLNKSLQTGFIDKNIVSETEYLPELLVNDSKKGLKVLSSINKELKSCQEFWFSVAFVTTGGIASLKQVLLTLEENGIKGKILVSQYLNFTQPEALRQLINLKNLEVRIAVDYKLHSKGFLFKKDNFYDLIIGSSNLTENALSINIEWNLKITAAKESHIITNAISEFQYEFDRSVVVDKEYISNYEILYKKQFDYSKLLKKELIETNQSLIIPNSMQIEALNNLEKLRSKGKNKALLISATGTGKTYLSAFDVKKVNPKKFLFIVHRLNIAIASLKTFKSIFGISKSMGIYSGNKKQLDCDFIFCTIQTLSKPENLNQFDSELFEYIVIDESHRAGSNSYSIILNHFRPKFLLGMTATPERTDGFDIFKLYDHNIAFEIRLHKALEAEMLSPFHYFGVTDISVDGKELDDHSEFNLLTSNERVSKIIEKSNKYGCDNGKVRGLIFCSKIEEANSLSESFNKNGFKTISLSGQSSEEERFNAIEKLESDSKEKIDYIFTVDIFNEGIDIPRVNQIIMLRPTQSAIIFVQQLGRGLRKTEDKQYLTVIDFIGNYKNNFMVPIALYGDNSYNKDTLRSLLSNGSRTIPGSSTINFDQISLSRIYKSIDSEKISKRAYLVKDYELLKFKLGRIPMMIDFLENDSRDPYQYIDCSKSYLNFVKSIETNYTTDITNDQLILLELFSVEVNNSKRLVESLILKELIKNEILDLLKFKFKLIEILGHDVSNETIDSSILNINFDFIRKSKKIIKRVGQNLFIDIDLKNSLSNEVFKIFLNDSIETSIFKYQKDYSKNQYIEGLVLNRKYSRKDVCRILNWPEDISSTVYGYRTKNNKTPCFVTYHKSDEISDTTKYNDYFINQNTFVWQSRSNRKIESIEIQNLINSESILLFIKKDDGEGYDFYFIGKVDIIEESIKQNLMPDKTTPIVNFEFRLRNAVNEPLYEYLTTSIPVIKNTDIQKSYSINNTQGTLVVNEPSLVFNSKSPFRILDKNEIKQFENCIPKFDIKAAAGNFSNFHLNSKTEWVELNKIFKYSSDYFICQVTGESMNKRIPNGSWCLFKKNPVGSRSGKIVLVHHGDIQDSDYFRGYTVKQYESTKKITEESWSHDSITLKPLSYDNSFKNIELNYEVLNDLYVVGEFVEVLG